MKLTSMLLASGLLFQPLFSEAAYKNYSQGYRLTYIENGSKWTRQHRKNFGFRVDVIGDNHGRKREQTRNGHPFIRARKGERYAVRLHNPLPVRVAVNLTVDGINTITGQPSGIKDGSKWIIEPHSYITIRGWQVNKGDARRFYFTDKPKSYAKWRSKDFDQDLSVNCGVIGAAYFWNKKELQRYYDQHPTYIHSPKPYSRRNDVSKDAKKSMPNSRLGGVDARERRSESELQAGTGMGERESHPIRMVNFKTTTGMNKLAQAVLIYYDFEKQVQPNPFPKLGFAPEMTY